MSVCDLLVELSRLVPEREYIYPPLLGLSEGQVLVREFRLNSEGKKARETPIDSWFIEGESTELVLQKEVQSIRARLGRLFAV